jgi:nucleoside-diphosphate-sugar epimerase
VRGTINVVEQAIKAGVKKISVAGSAVSIADLANPKPGSTEDDWVPASRELAHSQPTNYMLHYVVSKVLAEKALRDLVEKHTDVNVASVNPPFFIGPFAPGLVIPAGDHSVLSTNLILFNALLPGSKSRTPPIGFVDVRDVAAGLIAGLNVPGHTRNIIISPWFDLTEAVAYVGEIHPELENELPKLTATNQKESPFFVEASLKRLGIEVKPWKETVRGAVDDLLRIEKEWVSGGVDVNAEGGLRKNPLRNM